MIATQVNPARFIDEDTIEFYSELIQDLATKDFISTLFDHPPDSFPYFFGGMNTNIPINSNPLLIYGIEWYDPFLFDPQPPIINHPLIWVGNDIFEDVEFLYDLHRVPFSFQHGTPLLKAITKEFVCDHFSSIYLKYSFTVNHWLPASDKALNLLCDRFTSLDQDFSRWVEQNPEDFDYWLEYIHDHFLTRDCHRKIEIIQETFLS